MRCAGILLAALASAAAAVDFDVVVYGSTPAGVAAATAAGKLGMRVALFEPLKMIGGMGAAGNLALNDGGETAERTGLARVFTLLNGKAYGLNDTEVAHPESFVAAASFDTMLASAGVRVSLDCRLLSATAAATGGVSRVSSITVLCEKQPVTATVFIDASYDADIVVAVGDVPYTAGREAIATYNESLAGARVPSWAGVSGPKNVDALRPDGTLLKYVANLSSLAAPGEADDALMAFQHRMCISGDADRVPWPQPPGYDADDFLLIQRALDAANGDSNFFTSMPPSKLPGYPGSKLKYCLCCGITIAASDQPMLNKGWANASWERKQEMIADHVYFELGTFFYLANDPRVPSAVRAKFSAYGLCADEFQEYGHLPPQLYIRISNRLVGDYVMTQNNIAAPRSKVDSIAVGDWSLDEHMTGKYAVPTGVPGEYEVMLEGNFWPSLPNHTNWYDVPFSIMTPKRGTGANLLVPVCLSASAVAYSSTRIENMFMSVGTAAGVAAQQLVDGSVATVQDVDVAKVQAILTGTFAQRIHGPPGTKGAATPEDVSSTLTFDVVVYGASPGGIAAAITAANNTGLRVALLEPSPLIGGMSGPGGIGLRDTASVGEGGHGTVLHAWLRCVNAAYGADGITIRQPDYNVSQACWDDLVARPEYRLTVVRNAPLDEATDAVTRTGRDITSIRLTDGSVWAARIFVDATYEADLMQRVATFTIGREARVTYGEPLAGVLNDTLNHAFQQFPAGVSPYWPNGTLLDGVEEASASPAPGEADDRVMPSSWRLCITKDKNNSVPWPRPEGYDAAKYELLIRFAEKLGDNKAISNFVGVYDYYGYPTSAQRPQKYDLCENGALSTDQPSHLYTEYVTASYARRVEIRAIVRNWVAGWAYTLANEPRVPASTRESFSSFGLCADAWADNGHWPLQMYVREGARLVGDHVMTQVNTIAGACVPSSIAIGAWTIDIHLMRRHAGVLSGLPSAVNEGEVGFQHFPGTGVQYEVPYSAIVPRRADVTNLLVPVTPSVSHVTFGSLRVEPAFLALGTAAGAAAHLAVHAGVDVQDVNIGDLQAALVAATQCVRLTCQNAVPCA